MQLAIDEQIEKRIMNAEAASALTVFTVSKDAATARVLPKLTSTDLDTCYINDSEHLAKETKSMHRHLRYERPFETLKEAVKSVCLPVEISYQDFSISLGSASIGRKGASLEEKKKIVYVKEDAIEANKLVHYLSFFYDLPPSQRPTVFLETASPDARLAREMARASSSLQIKPLYEKSLLPSSPHPIDGREAFAAMFFSGAYGACTKYSGKKITEDRLLKGDGQDTFSDMATELLRIKSFDYEGDKFKALPSAMKLLTVLERAKEVARTDDTMNKLLSLKAHLGLWVAYIDESYVSGIENSMAIATHLNDEILFAHGLRLAHLVSGFSKVTDDFVSKSVSIFQRNGMDAFYVHAKNNLLLNRMHTSQVPCDEFADLAEYAFVETPYLDRLANIFNNAGTAYLVSDRLEEANHYYERAAKFSGQSIHYIGIALNKLVTKYLDGQKISREEVLKLHRRIRRANLPVRYAYHQSYMHWNLVVISDFDPEVRREIYSYLADKKFMDYGDVLNNSCTMIDFLARNMKSAKVHGRFPGARGEFIHKKQIVPIIHYSWM